ncbi:hypothetical protein GALMADRAFT_135870 [Galerina marginata CBS 339.88]|uniref:Uncharacterized protein n=1 Tax=Galerina marginata (strain CBS 339.88) TaxID=685588 RepID=A0A067TC64_GALM3|nr:hypothetical protein GALMADRAFT_135870 [Galerina marginata CBS 339.88]
MFSPRETEHLLRGYLGVVIVASFRALYIFSWRKGRIRRNDTATPESAESAESQPLLPTATAVPHAALSTSQKWFCCLAAISYMAETAYVTRKTIEEYQGRVLYDGRFMMARGGMFLLGALAIVHTIQANSAIPKMRLRADAVALVTAPFVMELLWTPAADFPTRGALDFILAPAFGWACYRVAR